MHCLQSKKKELVCGGNVLLRFCVLVSTPELLDRFFSI